MKVILCFVIAIISTPLSLGCSPPIWGGQPTVDNGQIHIPIVRWEWFGKGEEDREQWEGNQVSVPVDCLHCMCQVESNCTVPNPICQGEDTSESCGPYKIKENYWIGGGSLGGSWKECASERQCSEATVQGYMNNFATDSRLGHTPTCEDFSRIHTSGPTGYQRASAVAYWKKVKECLDN